MMSWRKYRASAFARLTLLSNGESLGTQARYRQIIPLILLLPLLLLTGCSWLAEILVVNNSKHTAAITFITRDINYPDSDFKPKVYRIERWSQDSVPVLYDTISVYTRKENDSTWYVELPPGNALVIAEGLNVDMRNDEQLNLVLAQSKTLEIKMPNDAVIRCEGSDCKTNIRKFSRGRAGIVLH